MNNLNQLLSGNLNAGEIVPYLGPDNGKAESIKRLKEWTQDRKFRQSGNDLSWNVSKRPIFLDGKDTGFSAIQRDDTGNGLKNGLQFYYCLTNKCITNV